MIILKPIAAQIDPHNHYTTKLEFEGGAVKEFYMRGSIAWPAEGQEGFALMAGYDLRALTVIIFEQFPFWTFPNWLNNDGTIRKRDDGDGYHFGLLQFILNNQAKYKCTSFFWGGQHVDTWNRWGAEVYRHKETPRRIELIEVPYVSEVGDGLLLEKLKTQKFKGQRETILASAVKKFKAMQNTDGPKPILENSVLALQILLAGFEYQPWVSLKGRAA